MYYRGREHELEQMPKVLALLSYHMTGWDQGLKALRTLAKEAIRLEIWADQALPLPKEWSKDVHRLQAHNPLWMAEWFEESKDRFQYLFIPVLSFSLISKLVQMDDEHPYVQLILWSLLSGKQVAALTAGIDPYGARGDKRFQAGPPLLKQQIRKHIDQLRSYGIAFLDESQIHQWLTAQRDRQKRVITSKDIEQARLNRQNQIIVSRQTIITPLAADLAEESYIQIIRK
ncbi:hypothetical protein [Thermoflavimicrobium dichotomicum]|uniref:hypothetical protein n=1 Tax=Thermoflavimicrobium dichotomicum TaxID=46223 RepID=UPI000B8312E3|nr:hypothetical protein [Thermoflavimicrobium dichotomicum]